MSSKRCLVSRQIHTVYCRGDYRLTHGAPANRRSGTVRPPDGDRGRPEAAPVPVARWRCRPAGRLRAADRPAWPAFVAPARSAPRPSAHRRHTHSSRADSAARSGSPHWPRHSVCADGRPGRPPRLLGSTRQWTSALRGRHSQQRVLPTRTTYTEGVRLQGHSRPLWRAVGAGDRIGSDMPPLRRLLLHPYCNPRGGRRAPRSQSRGACPRRSPGPNPRLPPRAQRLPALTVGPTPAKGRATRATLRRVPPLPCAECPRAPAARGHPQARGPRTRSLNGRDGAARRDGTGRGSLSRPFGAGNPPGSSAPFHRALRVSIRLAGARA